MNTPRIICPLLLCSMLNGSAFAAERLVLENECLRLTFDPGNGGLVSMVNRKTGSECLAQPADSPPFVLDIVSANKNYYIKDYSLREFGGFSLADPDSINFYPGDIRRLRAESRLLASDIAAVAGGVRLTCTYEVPPSLTVITTVTVRNGSPVTIWTIRVRNDPAARPREDLRLFRVAFPVLERLALGGNHDDDFLARPFAQGQLIPDPASYAFHTPANWAKRDNVLTYIGWATMPWQDLYDQRGGIFLASYDPSFQQIDMETAPDAGRASISMDIRTLADLWPGRTWVSQEFAVAVHEGDWHWAADAYREASSAILAPVPKPEWVRNADGWFGTGGGNYRYEDLPAMYEQAKWLGLTYLQVWSEMLEPVDEKGNRKGYYAFFLPDPERGGEKALREAVKKIRADGGHIGFYSNAWTFDATLPQPLEKYRAVIPAGITVPDWWREFRSYASVFPDGSREAGDYTREGGYAGMCVGAEGWQDYLAFWIGEKYVRDYGVDAWYIDSFPVTMFGAARICFSTEHGAEHPHGVGRGCLELLRKLRERSAGAANLAIASETVSDALAQYQSHALGLELVGSLMNHPKPEIYAYSFPEFPIFSGTCNNYNGTNLYYPGETGKFTHEDALNRVFLIGNRFDVIGWPLKTDNPYWVYVKKLIALRKAVKSELLASHFRDDIGLGSLPPKVEAKVFRHTRGESLTLTIVDRRERKEPFDLSVDPRPHGVSGLRTAALYTFEGGKPIAMKKGPGGTIVLRIPSRTENPAAIVVR
jgi:hypothetical protein